MSVADEIGRLQRLHERGVLSTAEFAAAKERVLTGAAADEGTTDGTTDGTDVSPDGPWDGHDAPALGGGQVAGRSLSTGWVLAAAALLVVAGTAVLVVALGGDRGSGAPVGEGPRAPSTGAETAAPSPVGRPVPGPATVVSVVPTATATADTLAEDAERLLQQLRSNGVAAEVLVIDGEQLQVRVPDDADEDVVATAIGDADVALRAVAVARVQEVTPAAVAEPALVVSMFAAEAQGEVAAEDLLATGRVVAERLAAAGIDAAVDVLGDALQVWLPPGDDPEAVRELIGRTGRLELRPVLEVLPGGTPLPAGVAPCDQLHGDDLDPDEEAALCLRGTDPTDPSVELPRAEWSVLRTGPAALTGAEVADATTQQVEDQPGRPWVVTLRFTADGAQAFEALTGELACHQGPQRQLAIVVDGTVHGAPTVAQDVACGAGISGGEAVVQVADEAEAERMAAVLAAGALPLSMEIGSFAGVVAIDGGR